MSAGGIKLGSAVKGCTRGLENYMIFFFQAQSTSSCGWVELSGFLNYTPMDIVLIIIRLNNFHIWDKTKICFLFNSYELKAPHKIY